MNLIIFSLVKSSPYLEVIIPFIGSHSTLVIHTSLTTHTASCTADYLNAFSSFQLPAFEDQELCVIYTLAPNPPGSPI